MPPLTPRPDTPRRALLTADAVGGVFTQTLDLAEGLTRSDIGITLALLGPPMSDAQRRAAEAAGAKAVETGLPLDWAAEDPEAVRRAAARLAALAGDVGAEIVHLHAPAYAVAAYPAPVVAALHSCTTTWWRAVEGAAPLPPDFLWRRDLVAEGLARADAAYAPSRAFAEAAEAAYPGARLACVHNGRDPVPAAEGARFGALATGRWWDRAKGGDRLDAAAALAATPVEAAGPLEGPEGSRLAPRALHPLGPLSNGEVRQRLARARIYVSLARYEPFGLGVLEAAQAGCALLLSDIPTFRELWDGAARLIPGDDARAAAAALDALASDEGEARRLGEAARVRARRHTRAAMTRNTLALWRAAAMAKTTGKTAARSAA